MKPTVYIETTIVSYLTAWPSRDVHRLSHEIFTRDWWSDHRSSYDLYVSDFVLQEASRGDPVAAMERLKALDGIPVLPADPSADELAERLAMALALPPRARLDAAHLAIASVYGMSFLLTWNCRHLANPHFRAKIESACDGAGFSSPQILTPEQLMESP